MSERVPMSELYLLIRNLVLWAQGANLDAKLRGDMESLNYSRIELGRQLEIALQQLPYKTDLGEEAEKALDFARTLLGQAADQTVIRPNGVHLSNSPDMPDNLLLRMTKAHELLGSALILLRVVERLWRSMGEQG